jgi:hypothetical protein
MDRILGRDDATVGMGDSEAREKQGGVISIRPLVEKAGVHPIEELVGTGSGGKSEIADRWGRRHWLTGGK